MKVVKGCSLLWRGFYSRKMVSICLKLFYWLKQSKYSFPFRSSLGVVLMSYSFSVKCAKFCDLSVCFVFVFFTERHDIPVCLQ